ncbi:hypothetical protein ACHAQH_009103 [Verticillium albo-atrum]
MTCLPDFDDHEKNLFVAMFLNLKTKPDVDWEATAALVSLKNGSTSKSRYGQVCRKHGIPTYSQAFGTARVATTSAKGKTTGKTSATLGNAGIRKTTGRAGSKGKPTDFKTKAEDGDDKDIVGVNKLEAE